VLITDTGNKRVVVFDRDLNFISQFGGGGFEAGQFDEPVGIDVDDSGQVIVADTWNRRVQVFRPGEDGAEYFHVASFDVAAWYGQSMDNKPYITFTPAGNILVSDPEAGRLLEFNISGEFIRGWQDLSPTAEDFNMPNGLDFDPDGNLWASDASLNILMRFQWNEFASLER
jgi:sugar lactone lactonase YvrE